MDDRIPHQLPIGVLSGIEKDLQQVDRGDRDDRGCDLDLEAASIELTEEGNVRFSLIEAADEVLVTRNHHHDDKTCDERCVDKAEHGEDHFGFAQREDVLGDLPELEGKGKRIDGQRGDQAHVKDDQQPAA
ncbi:hypothetical protein D3C87_1592340 [compost metagenome]